MRLLPQEGLKVERRSRISVPGAESASTDCTARLAEPTWTMKPLARVGKVRDWFRAAKIRLPLVARSAPSCVADRKDGNTPSRRSSANNGLHRRRAHDNLKLHKSWCSNSRRAP